MKYIIYDIEVFPNLFLICFEDYQTKEKFSIEVSPYKNEIHLIKPTFKRFLDEGYTLVAYNCLRYDWVIIDYIISTVLKKKSLTQGLFNSLVYIKSRETLNSHTKIRTPLIPHIDLMCVHHFDNKAKLTSLKLLEFNMQMGSIEDVDLFDQFLSQEQRDIVIKYCYHDVKATVMFLENTLKKIQFRIKLSEEYNIDLMNSNDVDVGGEILLQALSDKLNLPKEEINELRTHREEMHIKDIISDIVTFNSVELSTFNEWWKTKTIIETKGQFSDLPLDYVKEIFEFTDGKLSKKGTCLKKLNIVYKGFQYDFGTGGIHGYSKSGVWKADDQYELILADVSSYYPNLAHELEFHPAHIQKDIFKSVIKELTAKKTHAGNIGDKDTKTSIKLALNGYLYGKSNFPHSFMYDPKFMMDICLNGQLLLVSLCEQIQDQDIEVIQINTDGILVKIHKSKKPILHKLCDDWMDLTGLLLDYDHFETIIQRDVNNYIGVYTNGKIKRKGTFDWKYADNGDWHKNFSQLIVYEAVEKYFLNDIPVEETIKNCDNIHMFAKRVKKMRSHKLSLNGKIYTSKVLRYFVTNEGDTLIKIMPPLKGKHEWRQSNVEKGFLCKAAQNIDEITFDEINYDYYIKEANKIIKAVKK